jgi:hypothetical protein
VEGRRGRKGEEGGNGIRGRECKRGGKCNRGEGREGKVEEDIYKINFIDTNSSTNNSLLHISIR